MIVCGSCGRANEDGARFCGACGRPLTAGVASPGAAAPSGPPVAPAVAGPARGRSLVGRGLRRLERTNPRWLLAFLLIAAFVLGAISLGSSWWFYTSRAAGGSISLGFVPGGDYVVTCSNCGGFTAGSFSYSAFGGSLGGLYEAILGLMAAAVALVALAAALALLAALGRRTGWWQRSGSFVLVFVALVLAWIAAIAVVAAQPGAFGAASTFQGLGPGNASPTTSFWGTDAAGTANWGAGAGWYLALAAGVLLVVIAAFLVLVGHERLRLPERTTRRPAEIPAPSRGYAPPPVASPTVRPVVSRPPPVVPTRVTAPLARPSPSAAPASPWDETPRAAPPATAARSAAPTPAGPTIDCPNCGTPNLARSKTCSYCQRPLRE